MKDKCLLLILFLGTIFFNVNAQTVEAKIFELKTKGFPSGLAGHLAFTFSNFTELENVESLNVSFRVYSTHPEYYLDFIYTYMTEPCFYEKNASEYTFQVCNPQENLAHNHSGASTVPIYQDAIAVEFNYSDYWAKPGSIVLIGAITEDGGGNGRIIEEDLEEECHSIYILITDASYKNIGDESIYPIPNTIDKQVQIGDCSTEIDPNPTLKTNQMNLSVYPIPANQEIVINNLDEAYQQIQLLDLNGKVHYQTINENTNSLRIPTYNLPTGHYILQMKGNEQFTNIKIPIVH